MLMNESFAPHFRCASRNARKVADGDRWHVAVGDEHVAIEVFRNFIEAKSHSVARAALRLLEREACAMEVHRGLDFASLVTDDDHDGIGIRFDCGDCANCAPNHRLAAKLVQNLGPLRAHAGPLAGGENDRSDRAAIRSHRN